MSGVTRCLALIACFATSAAELAFTPVACAFPPATAASVADDPYAEPTLSPSLQGASPVSNLNNDPTLRRWLKDARARFDAKQVIEGLTLLQRILDRGDDAFVRLRSDGPVLEVRLEALRMLSA